jgi:methyl-accepting chemotaxis protein
MFQSMKFSSLIKLLLVMIILIITVFLSISTKTVLGLGSTLNIATSDAIWYTSAINQSRQTQVNFQRQVQEWKNILIRGNDKALYEKYHTSFEKEIKNVDDGLASIKILMSERKMDLALIDKLIIDHQIMDTKYTEALMTWNYADGDSGKKVDLMLRGIDRATSEGMDKLAKNIEKESTINLTAYNEKAASQIRQSIIVVITGSIISLLLLVYFTNKVGKSLLRSIGSEPAELLKSLKLISKGDLKNNLVISAGDETSVAAHTKMMQMRMRNLVGSIKNSTSEFSNELEKLKDAKNIDEVKLISEQLTVSVSVLNRASSRFTV